MKNMYNLKNKKAMKTTKFFSVLSLALIIFGVTTGYSRKTDFPGTKNQKGAAIIHNVIVHTTISKNICNVYLVKVSDETGRLVAPPQIFVPGVSKYVFNENVNLKGRKRIATLELSLYPGHYTCPNDFFTPPDVEVGPFENGQILTFDLYPRPEDPNIDL
jgi:hypothetical protein